MYARNVDGNILDFGVSGKLIMNALVMYDRQTRSLWSQYLGSAVEGDFAGTQLEIVTSSFVSWETWLERHPSTVVLDQGRWRADAYERYYTSSSAGVIGEANPDDRFKRKEFVLSVQIPEGVMAFPFRHLNDEPVVNEQIGEISLVAVFDPDGATGYAFNHEVDGTLLSFEPVDGETLIRDRETGTLWNAVSGVAVDGPLAGQRLTALPAFASFWFAWSDFFPDGDVWTPVARKPRVSDYAWSANDSQPHQPADPRSGLP